MAICIGDEYEFATHPDRPVGKVKWVDYHSGKVSIEWNNAQLIPRIQEFSIHDFSNGVMVEALPWGLFGADMYQPLTNSYGPKCECGTSITLGSQDDPMFHSDYCPIYISWKASKPK
jgi:hypothetical protein